MEIGQLEQQFQNYIVQPTLMLLKEEHNEKIEAIIAYEHAGPGTVLGICVLTFTYLTC